MNSIVWNVRGVGNQSTLEQLWCMRNKLKLNVLVILEPMVKLDSYSYRSKFRMEKVISNVSNKIWIFSDENYDVEVIQDGIQYLYIKVTSNQHSTPLMVIVVYAKCNRRERKSLWETLCRLSNQSLPWCIRGDFNAIVDASERIGGSHPDQHSMQDFRDSIMDFDLVDIGFEGIPFTWQWKEVRQRLDRLLFNHKWLDHF